MLPNVFVIFFDEGGKTLTSAPFILDKEWFLSLGAFLSLIDTVLLYLNSMESDEILLVDSSKRTK